MSKNSGMGRKRIDNKDSKGLGKCLAGSRAEQCGNGRGINKTKFKWSGKASASNPFCKENPTDRKCEEIELLQKQAEELERDLKYIKTKMEKLNGNN